MTFACGRTVLTILLSLLLLPALTPCLPAAGQNATTGSSSQQAQADDDSADKDKDAPKDEVGELFPGVKGISGKDLARRIAELDRKKAEEQRRRPTTATTPSSGGSSTPAGGRTPDKPAQPAATSSQAKTEAASLEGISDEAREFLKELSKKTLRVEQLVEKAAEIRQDATVEARSLGSEERILYYLQYRGGFIREAKTYYQTVKFPILVYRYVYERAVEGLQYDREQRPADLPKEAVAAADADVARLKAVQRTCLLAAAELFTQIRQLDASQALYDLLLKRYPADKEIKQSEEAFVVVRDTPKPDGPPDIKPNRRYTYDPEDPTGTNLDDHGIPGGYGR